MSSNTIKTKESKGKRKALPKLKTILANPNKEKCPSLKEDELEHFGKLLLNAISKSGTKPMQFATTAHIHLGLESSLRAINNLKCSCVLLSRSIQPRFLVRLIARNVEAKNQAVPVFVLSQLEDFTKTVFGVGALALVLPTVTAMRDANMDTNLIKWAESQAKPVKPMKVKFVPKLMKKKRKNFIFGDPEEKTTKLQKSDSEVVDNNWGEFISFSDVMEIEKADSVEDEQHLNSALCKVVEGVNKERVTFQDENVKSVKSIPQVDVKYSSTPSSDSDDFLPEVYQPLTVHKIQPNPNKKPKKKRQKKNKLKKN
uniref:Uncharacterized protein n=1 Tax=Ceratitis capitata TaxID=7213 RepID=W8BI32_CERCA